MPGRTLAPQPLPPTPPGRAGSGIAGLDAVLSGGFVRERLHLVEGAPGAGKTTIALQFLREGARLGEAGLYVTISETAHELHAAAASHGWGLDGIEIIELAPAEVMLDGAREQSLLATADLELGETSGALFDAVERLSPRRVVIDSLSELRLLSQSPLRFRRQVLALKHLLARAGATALMLDDLTIEAEDRAVHSIAHGVVALRDEVPEYGAQRRRLRVTKLRGSAFRGGFHDYAILPGGVAVYPRLVAAGEGRSFAREATSTGVAGLDAQLGGGLVRGTSTLILGPSGAGKSLIAVRAALAAAARGERAVVYAFDEEGGLLRDRVRGLGLDLDGPIAAGLLRVRQVDAAELSPGEFAHAVRREVEEEGARFVLVDSLNGYHAAMPQEQFLLLHLHEMLTYLNRLGAVTVLTMAQHGIVGDMRSPVDATYVSDALVLLRFFEAAGAMRRAISVVKNRAAGHEDTIREFRIDGRGLSVGEPLREFHGVLRGVPSFVGRAGDLMDGSSPGRARAGALAPGPLAADDPGP